MTIPRSNEAEILYKKRKEIIKKQKIMDRQKDRVSYIQSKCSVIIKKSEKKKDIINKIINKPKVFTYIYKADVRSIRCERTYGRMDPN